MLVGIAMQSCRMTCLSMTVIMHKQTIATTEELKANSDYGKQSKGELLNVTAFTLMNTYILQHQQCQTNSFLMTSLLLTIHGFFPPHSNNEQMGRQHGKGRC
ncbi:hypothetical protein DERF_005489 [Dermatophagoides farinae]|uniref:Uncharacterized protein n=1 Tax=Dermatophagoides farinae TaxID=6954 RepID=A0A922I4D4_DERFA|nr:hypothetical protein DERF_005489 [Dermatophagoides farinae]